MLRGNDTLRTFVIMPPTFAMMCDEQSTCPQRAQDAVYVSDSAGLRKFSQNGELLADWTGSGQFGDPYGLAVDAAGTVYVADTDNGRIASVSPTGEVQAAWGSEGKGIGQLKYPEAVAVDSQGVLYVADRGNDRVQTFTLPAR